MGRCLFPRCLGRTWTGLPTKSPGSSVLKKSHSSSCSGHQNSHILSKIKPASFLYSSQSLLIHCFHLGITYPYIQSCLAFIDVFQRSYEEMKFQSIELSWKLSCLYEAHLDIFVNQIIIFLHTPVASLSPKFPGSPEGREAASSSYPAHSLLNARVLASTGLPRPVAMARLIPRMWSALSCTCSHGHCVKGCG